MPDESTPEIGQSEGGPNEAHIIRFEVSPQTWARLQRTAQQLNMSASEYAKLLAVAEINRKDAQESAAAQAAEQAAAHKSGEGKSRLTEAMDFLLAYDQHRKG